MKVDDLKDEDLIRICSNYGVKVLYAFGSVASGNMSPVSDLDFQVIFSDPISQGAFDRFMDFRSALENKYGRKVDLIAGESFRNPIFAEALNKTRVTVYVA